MSVYFALGPEGFGAYEVETHGSVPRMSPTNASAEKTLIPGFVDIHIHGAFGIDFMSASQEEMVDLCDKLEGCGYEKFLPTTVTASLEDVRTALGNLPDHPLIGGFHLEGPFISPVHPGAQPKEWIVSAEAAAGEWKEVLEDERLKVVTLAPELPGALELTEFLSARGVVVSMGHTDATYMQASQGFHA